MIGHDWSWLVRIGHDWSWLVTIGQDWSWLVMIGQDWSQLVMIGHDWSGLVRISHDWSWLVRIGHDWSRLVMIGHDWSWLVRIGQDWSGLVMIGHNWPWLVMIMMARNASSTLRNTGTRQLQDQENKKKNNRACSESLIENQLLHNSQSNQSFGFFVTVCVVRGEVQYAGFAVIGRGENIHSRPALPNTHNWVFSTMKKLFFEHWHNKCL